MYKLPYLKNSVTHPERVFGIQINRLGDLLVSYYYMTVRVWDMTTGECFKTVTNPAKLFCRERQYEILWERVQVHQTDPFSLHDDSAEYDTQGQIDEQNWKTPWSTSPHALL